MTTSGSTDFNENVRQIITAALRYIHVIEPDATPTAADAATALEQLQFMMKTWSATDDPKLWLVTSGSQVVTQGQASYEIDVARKMLSVRRRTSNIDTPLIPWSREQYENQPNKAGQGTPNSWYFDTQRSTRILYIWLTPDAYAAANTTLQYTYLRVIEDVDDLSNDFDVPQEWMEALMTSLAARLLVPYRIYITDPTGAAEIKQRAEMIYSQLASWDEESVSIFLQPA